MLHSESQPSSISTPYAITTKMAFRPLLLSHILALIAALLQFQTHVVICEPQVPCYFIFGGSLVDPGNNNRLITLEKANYPPYGIDFPEGPTGRFTNGRTTADFIGQRLGFSDFIPPYATATNEQISMGVNYGSGGAGIREESGINLGDRISFDRQVLNHGAIVSRLAVLQRNITFTNEYLKKCIYLVNIGTNDYVNNYLMPNRYATSRLFTPEQYATVLVQQLSQQLTTLYTLGARSVAVFGLGQIGCAPQLIQTFGTNGRPCVESINNVTRLFNDRLRPLVDELNNNLRDARFTFINMTSIMTRAVSSTGGVAPLSRVPCCQTQSIGLCVPNSVPCSDRNLRLWYDGFHPTEIANSITATRAYNARSPLDASPYDISQLAQP